MTLHEPIRRALSQSPKQIPLEKNTRFAAVAAIIDSNNRLLLIHRAEFENDPWSGHIAFPGGAVEPTDASPLQGAIREVQEEIGITLLPEQCVGPLNDIGTSRKKKGLIVRPFVFLVQKLPPHQVNREVQAILQWPLAMLLENKNRSSMPYTYNNQPVTLPIVEHEGHRLWGLTLLMVDDLLHRLDGKGTGLQRLKS